MTSVEFHFNAADKLNYTCRLLRKANAKGSNVVVIAQQPLLSELDAALWSFDTLSFLPHCVAGGAADNVLTASPIVIADSTRLAPHADVLVNLSNTVPAGFERFERLIEVVSQDQQDRLVARQRWKHYADRGYSIDRKEVESKSA
ncbi:DNA polymerase III subunit chi [Caenimonas koreensis]|uniref:DNA polymerase III subunit chi n=1 Tax=Caenimonas koreensis DSM 17982 TaxID=1121255 RepID=A0A844ANY0_9BURK|nr:DNA polymerase III subunit chi [Caenimonas koreensis]MRD45655.1 DNA polymerase III subunit chi [Caenimonas koreensis DSM 17982]